jgi:hypothetical protein
MAVVVMAVLEQATQLLVLQILVEVAAVLVAVQVL